MITIYANWTGNALASGKTLDDARSKLNAGHCDRSVTFGAAATDLTALDTGPHEAVRPTNDKFDTLHVAREFFPAVAAEGPGRLS